VAECKEMTIGDIFRLLGCPKKRKIKLQYVWMVPKGTEGTEGGGGGEARACRPARPAAITAAAIGAANSVSGSTGGKRGSKRPRPLSSRSSSPNNGGGRGAAHRLLRGGWGGLAGGASVEEAMGRERGERGRRGREKMDEATITAACRWDWATMVQVATRVHARGGGCCRGAGRWQVIHCTGREDPVPLCPLRDQSCRKAGRGREGGQWREGGGGTTENKSCRARCQRRTPFVSISARDASVTSDKRPAKAPLVALVALAALAALGVLVVVMQSAMTLVCEGEGKVRDRRKWLAC
jgi:hypothetical protein